MAELKALKKKRAIIKSRVTQFANYVEGLSERTNILEMMLADVEVEELDNRLERFKPIFTEFAQLQQEIEEATPAEKMDEQIEERTLFDESYDKPIIAAKAILKKHAVIKAHQEKEIQASNSGVQVKMGLGGCKLPAIKVPAFYGKSDSWLEFRDTFIAIVHTNPSIGEIHKYHYLRDSLKGEAADVIKALAFSAQSYELAWKTLCERYNNTRRLVHNHMKALFDLEPLHKESSSAIRTICDTMSKHLRSLEQLGLPVQQWDAIIVYMITEKLDMLTCKSWEEFRRDIEFPTFEELNKFLQRRAELVETVECRKGIAKIKVRNSLKTFQVRTDTCEKCHEEHFLGNCPQFKELPQFDRLNLVKKTHLCLNCFKRGHFVRQCRSQRCSKCNSKHHVLLHADRAGTDAKEVTTEVKDESKIVASTFKINEKVLLATARVVVKDASGKKHAVRALLDSGSQSSFLSRELCDRLKLKTKEVSIAVTGLNNAVFDTKARCEMTIESMTNSFSKTISCFVLNEITDKLPSTRLNKEALEIPNNLVLADTSFYLPGTIDLLIGADIFWSLMCIGQVKLGESGPILQKTRLGWIITGPININAYQTGKVRCNFSINSDLQGQLAQFWELEECSLEKSLSKEETRCEENFKATTLRNGEGRFVVTIPLKEPVEALGESRSQAERRFFALERKFIRNVELKKRYTEFMVEYENLGHLSEVTEAESDYFAYYAPHHGVIKEDSSTTKLRVVFDCSAKTASGYSLNDIQMVGPTIQEDLLSIVLRFRKHAFVVTGDIEKMYRQVLVTPGQRNLQRILWRANSTDVLKEYNLNTVTYGTAAAAFLAIRCLHQLADECADKNPIVSSIIRRDFYVDDVITGGDNLEELTNNCEELLKVLKTGCFKLRKWRSNNRDVLRRLNEQENSSDIFKFNDNETGKTLGVVWSSHSDQLTYKINKSLTTENLTKRKILSKISQIFDPLGLLGPCIVIVKILMQKIWMQKIDWDDSLPVDIYSEWFRFEEELPSLSEISIPRYVKTKGFQQLQIHGFSDASEKAYGACIYIRTTNGRDTEVHLLCAKSKVAPLKTITLPRLELCGAVLLVRLINKTLKTLKEKVDICYLWSDSTIVLGWIKTPPNLLKQFVGNRVAEIQDLEMTHFWRHIRTTENPADYLSRGIYPRRLRENNLWWYGPSWLAEEEENWPKSMVIKEELPELRSQIKSLLVMENTEAFPLQRFSKISRLKRSAAYVKRFIKNCRTSVEERITGPLTAQEIKNAFIWIAKLAQRKMFPSEIRDIQKNGHLGCKGKLAGLNPFIDEDDILRVGGRIKYGPFEYEKKHPMILAAGHHFTKLIFEAEHLRLMHAGAQALLASVRENFWTVGGRSESKRTVARCVVCFRARPKVVTPIMGNLPERRLIASHPFCTTGTDFAGPVMVKDKKGRGARLSKAYICLFICFATKAIHLELVSELSTDCFLMALRRFVARRGKPQRIYSDNAKNYVGARARLNELMKFVNDNKTSLIDGGNYIGIEWSFIPPYSPHFGGLWEAGIKSVKFHLNRVLQNSKLHFEEYATLLTQVEAILNSRPLVPLSNESNDLAVLTPAHFLIGKPLLDVVEENVAEMPRNRLNNFQHLQMLKRHFWERWNKEYISELQQRTKWKSNFGSLKEGALVVVKEDNLPPLCWRLGRILALHPGKDGVARVATIQFSSGQHKRAFSKICPLPL